MTVIGERTEPRITAEDRNPERPQYAADLAKELRRAVRGEVRFDPGRARCTRTTDRFTGRCRSAS